MNGRDETKVCNEINLFMWLWLVRHLLRPSHHTDRRVGREEMNQLLSHTVGKRRHGFQAQHRARMSSVNLWWFELLAVPCSSHKAAVIRARWGCGSWIPSSTSSWMSSPCSVVVVRDPHVLICGGLSSSPCSDSTTRSVIQLAYSSSSHPSSRWSCGGSISESPWKKAQLHLQSRIMHLCHLVLVYM